MTVNKDSVMMDNDSKLIKDEQENIPMEKRTERQDAPERPKSLEEYLVMVRK